MATWIIRFDALENGAAGEPDEKVLRVAVKDAIDMAGVVTTAGCKALADRAEAAAADAECLAGTRAAEHEGRARIVGKTNLHELCFGTTGANDWYGMATNPLDATRMPGGSSSGSAVAVANDEADVAFGTDTGGSVRLPAACCGIVGLKTTFGRVSTRGVWPLSPSLDTVGPLARDVATVVQGMDLLEPGFAAAHENERQRRRPGTTIRVARLRLSGVDPAIETAVDRAIAHEQVTAEVDDLELEGWTEALTAFGAIIMREAYESNERLLRDVPEGIGEVTRQRLEAGRHVTDDQVTEARATQQRWKDELEEQFQFYDVLALPTLLTMPPPATDVLPNPLMSPFNLAGLPAISIPIPLGDGWPDSHLPTSLQLVGPPDSEIDLCLAAVRIEEAVAASE